MWFASRDGTWYEFSFVVKCLSMLEVFPPLCCDQSSACVASEPHVLFFFFFERFSWCHLGYFPNQNMERLHDVVMQMHQTSVEQITRIVRQADEQFQGTELLDCNLYLQVTAIFLFILEIIPTFFELGGKKTENHHRSILSLILTTKQVFWFCWWFCFSLTEIYMPEMFSVVERKPLKREWSLKKKKSYHKKLRRKYFSIILSHLLCL